MAKDHHEEEEVWNVKHQSTPKSDKETINSSFVFSESMQDDFFIVSKLQQGQWKNVNNNIRKILEG